MEGVSADPAEPRDDEARVSTLELFFDLVFVFTITQLTSVLTHQANAGGLARVVLMLTVIWWMYGGYAWLTNAVAPDRAAYQMLLLGGMAGFLVLSLAIPHAFSGDGVVFGLAYAAIVLIHGGLFTRSAGVSAGSILRLAPLNLVMALLIVVAGAVGGAVQYVLWCAALAPIAYTTIVGPPGSFDVIPSHFVERHGLVVIVALGESVVAVGIGASGASLTGGMIGVAVLGLALSACLWWTYFGEGGDELALEAFRRADPRRRPRLALNAFYWWHLVILLGIIALSSALERAIAHPSAPLSFGHALALGGGAALFMLGDALFRRSVEAGRSSPRLLAAAIALATIPLGTGVDAVAQLAALAFGLSLCLVVEHRQAIAAAAVLVAALGLTGCGGAGGDEPAPASRTPSLTVGDLHRCKSGPTPRSLRCGEIWAPYERADPSLGKTRIGFAVVPRSDRRRPPRGTIFAVEGGPGYASSWTVRSYVKLFGSLLDRHDLVMVDMRGTGRSRPLDCPDLQFGRAPDWIALPQYAAKLGPRFSSYRTSAAADDIDAVRRALGLGHITLYGDSYGTFLAQSYAFRHPETLNAVVFDSAYPARGESAWYPSLISTGVRSLAIACRRSAKCHGNARRRLGKLVVWLRSRHRGVGALVDAMSTAGYTPFRSYLKIDRAGTALRRGDATPWKVLIAQAKLGYGHLRHYSATDEKIVSCNDYPLLWSKDASEQERRAELERKVRTYRNAAALAPFKPREVALSSDTLYQYCLGAPRPSSLYEPPIKPGEKPTNAPVLVVSGEFDNVTSPYEGRLVAREFANSRQFVARGAGHVADLYDASSPPAVRTRHFLRHVLDGQP